jgi:membrane fusion protein, adhesin transport system
VPTPFLSTQRALEQDGYGRFFAVLAVTLTLLAAWAWWFLQSRVGRYEVTAQARIEVDRATHPIQPVIAGRVTRTNLTLGANVKAGDILIELDAIPEKLQIAEEQVRATNVTPQIQSLLDEQAALRQGSTREEEATRVAIEENRAKLKEAEVALKYAESEIARLQNLDQEGLIPRRDLDQGRTEAERRRAAAESLKLTLDRLESEQRTRTADRGTRLERLTGEIRQLEAQRRSAGVAVNRLQYNVEQRVVRAPVSGRLADVAILRPGAYVNEGQTLGVVIPDGQLRVVAEFAPPAALGRVRAGQPAKIRLDGFPWTQYGSVDARVYAVAGEIRNGTVRVEMELAGRPPVALQHGMPGSAEVLVEQVSPAVLALRAAGHWIASPKSPY